MATKFYKGQEVEILSTKGGWSQIITQDGRNTKVRNSAFDGAKASRPRKGTKPKNEAAGRAIANTPVNRFESYKKVKLESGNASFDSDDALARGLRNLPIEKVYTEAARALREAGVDEFGITIGDIEATLVKRYSKLNLGMQRMNLGNRIRGARRAVEAA